MAPAWEDVGPPEGFATLLDGKDAAKRALQNKFKTVPGGGVTRAYFRCNMHKECEFRMCVVKKDGVFRLQQQGEHGTEIEHLKRKNSALTYDQEAAVAQAVECGVRPAAILASFTSSRVSELQEAGEDVMDHKNDQGGLEGEQHVAIHMYCAAVLDVFLMYSFVFRRVLRALVL